MSTKKTYLTNISAQGLGRVFTTVVSLTIYILIARLLGTEVFGQYSYILTFLSLFAVATDFGTQSVFARDIAQVKDSAETYWGNFLMLRVGLSLLVVIPAVITAYYLRQDLFFYLLIGCLSLPFLSFRFFEPLYQVYNRPWFSAYSSLIYGFLYLLFAILAFLFSRNLLSIFLAYVGSNVMYAIIALFLALKLLTPKFEVNGAVLKKILKLSLPMGVASLFSIINSRADIFMLAYMKSNYEVGIYNAAYRFLDMTVMVTLILMNPIIPIFSEKAVNDRKSLKKTYIKLIELFAIITIPVAIVVPHVSSIIITLLFGAAFSGSAQVLNILVWVGILTFYSILSAVLCLSIGVVKQAYWNCALAASLNIFLNYLWIPKYSYIGSAWATLICEVLLLSTTLYYAIKHMGNVFDWIKWSKIIAVNLVLYFLLGSSFYEINLFLKICGSLMIYLFMVCIFYLITKEDVRLIFPIERSKADV
jgi:O-antigen/teichoic acid export membrane protein